MSTPSGVRFGLLGERGNTPAPTLFFFAGSIELTLGDDAYNKVGQLLAGKGFIIISLDLPSHGGDVVAGEPAGLEGWRVRLEKGDDLVNKFDRKVSTVLDYLIKEGYTDPQKVAACGTSRGGFIAFHFAAADKRVKNVAAFSPVTELIVLREFAGLENDPHIRSLALANLVDKLAGRGIWVSIGNNDHRVGTDQAIAFTRKAVAADIAQSKPADVELHVHQAIGHTSPANAHEYAAEWLLQRVTRNKSTSSASFGLLN